MVIAVADINDVVPEFASASVTADALTEGQTYRSSSDAAFDAVADVIFTASAVTDIVNQDGTPVYPIVRTLGGTDAGDFDIDSDGRVTFKATTPAEADGDNPKTSYAFTITATVTEPVNGGTDRVTTASQNVSIAVQDINDVAPAFTHTDPDDVVKGQTIKGGTAGLVVYRASATPDVGTVTYSFKDPATGDEALFDIDETSGAVTFTADHVAGTVNGADKTSYTFTVIATVTETVPGGTDSVTTAEQ